MKSGQTKVDEFAFILLAGVILIVIMLVTLGLPSEAPPYVQPTTVSLDAPVGATSVFELNITGKLSNVSLSATGNVMSWISFNKNNFDILDYSIVKVRVNVPLSASGVYTATVAVESPGGKQTIPVTINVVEGRAAESHFSRPIVLGDFSVSYSVGSETIASKDDFEVSRGYLSSYPASLVGSLSDEQLGNVVDGSLHIAIDQTNSAGNLVVLFNGKEVFNGVTAAKDITIPIDKSMIESSNTVEMSAGTPGWDFWMSTVYSFSTATFTVDYKGVSSKEIPFDLDQNEIDNFDNFKLTFRVSDYTSPVPPLQIKINGELVYSQVPPLGFFEETFNRDIQGNKLLLDSNNTISFLFERPAFYSIDSSVLTVYYSQASD